MRAAVLPRYGPPQVLEIRQLPRPEILPGRVLVQVHAAGINPIDWRIRSGSLRLVLPVRLPMVLGYDISGVVVEVGAGVSEFRPGEEVYAFLDTFRTGGGYAEYALVSPLVLARKPARLGHVEAAAVPLAALTALQALRDLGELRPHSQVLVNGAAGGVGSFAVQIARILGAEVTGVCGPANVEFVRQLEVDRVLDYSRTDFAQQQLRYDVVFDAVAKRSYWSTRRALGPRGRYITTVPSASQFVAQGLSWLGHRRSQTVWARPSGDDLRWLQEQIDAGQLRPSAVRSFPLEEVALAHAISQTGHVRGKLVLKLV